MDRAGEHDVAVALIAHLLSRESPSPVPKITERLAFHTAPVTVQMLLDDHPAFTSDGSGGWRVADLRGEPPEPLGPPMGRERARYFTQGGIVHAVLPEGLDSVLQRGLQRTGGTATLDNLMTEVWRNGWIHLSRTDVLLHMAHFWDYQLSDGGRWTFNRRPARPRPPRPAAPLPEKIMPGRKASSSVMSTASGRRNDGPTVYVTSYGAAYHYDPNCHLLRRGRAIALSEGRGVTSVQARTMRDVNGSGHHACRGCTHSG